MIVLKKLPLIGFLFLQLWPFTWALSQPTTTLIQPTLSSLPADKQTGAITNSSQDAVPYIRSLIQAGRLAEASRELTRQLQKPHSEPDLQLLQCVVLSNQQKIDKSIACMRALIKVRPDMLEAYNNLGVLYANLGQHEEAKRWLTLAMQRMPSLWTVYQNLQTLQIDMSRKSYARALQVELPLAESPPRLTMLATTTLTNSIQVVQTASPPTPMPAASPNAKREAIKPEVDKIEAIKTEENKDNGVDNVIRQQLQAAVESWAQAWSAQNIAAYFAAYTSDFTPSQSISRTQWEAERTSRIVGRKFVKVSVSNFQFEHNGSKMIVRFNQFYQSDNIRSKHQKRLDLQLVDGSWKIVRETLISQ